jgi:hypothetical protein
LSAYYVISSEEKAIDQSLKVGKIRRDVMLCDVAACLAPDRVEDLIHIVTGFRSIQLFGHGALRGQQGQCRDPLSLFGSRRTPTAAARKAEALKARASSNKVVDPGGGPGAGPVKRPELKDCMTPPRTPKRKMTAATTRSAHHTADLRCSSARPKTTPKARNQATDRTQPLSPRPGSTELLTSG